jgi:4-amino-4-deoxy-L-arabinose transferase-like glycosyltransferase
MEKTLSKLADLHATSSSVLTRGRVGRRSSMYLICGGIFLLAFTVRIALLFATKSYLDREQSELVFVATSLAEGHGFANAYGDTGPTAHTSPIYPYILSLLYRCVGSGVQGEIPQEILGCFFGALTWSLVPVLTEISQLGRRTGLVAALLGGLFPINRWAETKGSFEAPMAGLAALLMFLFYMKCWYSRDFSARAGLAAGVLSGLAVLVSSSLGSIAIGLLLVGYAVFRRSVGGTYLRFSLLAVLLVFVTLLPWALRNYFILGGLVWTRSNLPLELMVSNNNYAQPNLIHNAESMSRYHPFASPEQRTIVRRMGELAYEQRLKGEVLLWIRSHPRQFAWLTLQRIYYFWDPEMKRPVQTIALALLLLASIPALVLLLKEKQLVGYGIATIWATYPLVYYLVQSHPRYVYPIQWTQYLLATQTVLIVSQRWKGRNPFQNWGTVDTR